MKRHFIIRNIIWDTDGEDVRLPDIVTVEICVNDKIDIDLEGADILSDEYGYCVHSFDVEESTSKG